MKKVILCIMDGVGLREDSYGNAFRLANTPNLDYLWNNYPHSELEASGEYVGLPYGQMGNSEVGHTAIGAGRVVYESLVRIDNAILNKTFFDNEAFLKAINHCKVNNSSLHLIGMISDGGIHSHVNHLLAILDLCKKEDFNRVFIHAILDGRDTTPMEAPKHISRVINKINETGVGTIVTIGGRYYIMNRDRNWSLTEMGYNAIVNGISDINVSSITEAFENQYNEDLTDEFMKPTVIKKHPINNNDSIISFNYRSDRMIQFSRALLDPNFNDFKRDKKLDVLYVTMTEYEEEDYYKNVLIAFDKDDLKNTLGEVISNLGMRQLRLTEFEKRLHVTFYFSGCKNEMYDKETDIILERDDVFTYDLKPEMRSVDITSELIKASKDGYELIVLNYPNGDAVGHSGILEAAIKGVEAVDSSIGRIIKEINLDEYTLIITADHGNCEHMIESDGTPDKKHTTSKVPFILCDKKYSLNNEGALSNIAPTILEIMGIDKPEEMIEKSLII